MIPFTGTCFCESCDECLSKLLLLLTALAVSFRTCFRKLTIPAIGEKKVERETCVEWDILLESQMTSQGYEQKANKANMTNWIKTIIH